VRQPLAELVIAGAQVEALRPYLELIADEVNVKSVVLSAEIERYASFSLQVNGRAVGPRLGSATKQVIAASKRGEWQSLDDGRARVAGQVLETSEFALGLVPKEGVACEALPGNDAIVVLDLELTPELIQEGKARDVVRVVQQARKEADLHVADRIRLVLDLPDDEWRGAAERFRDYIAAQTLAVELEVAGTADTEGLFRHDAKVGSAALSVALARAS
jgi:isoleucyl-tRNA synthetase